VIFLQTVRRVRAGTRTDRGGNTLPDWSPGAVSRLVVPWVSVQPNTQAEDTDPTRTAAVTAWRVLSAPGTAPDVRADDRIEWNGLIFEVEGEVAAWPDPFDGTVHHVEFVMQRATG
jgi:hypothetical protein